jgi:hypothetical protein
MCELKDILRRVGPVFWVLAAITISLSLLAARSTATYGVPCTDYLADCFGWGPDYEIYAGYCCMTHSYSRTNGGNGEGQNGILFTDPAGQCGDLKYVEPLPEPHCGDWVNVGCDCGGGLYFGACDKPLLARRSSGSSEPVAVCKTCNSL